MSSLSEPSWGLLFSSVLFRSDLVERKAIIDSFEEKWGKSHYFFHPYFPMKEYYSKEMGDEDKLERFFLISKKTSSRSVLTPAKIWATDFENSHLKDGARKVNMDIGVLSLENVQLATGKNFVHRIYLDKGVFSDLNLTFKGKSFIPLPWTYPDYKNLEVIEIFNWMRTYLLIQLN